MYTDVQTIDQKCSTTISELTAAKVLTVTHLHLTLSSTGITMSKMDLPYYWTHYCLAKIWHPNQAKMHMVLSKAPPHNLLYTQILKFNHQVPVQNEQGR